MNIAFLILTFRDIDVYVPNGENISFNFNISEERVAVGCYAKLRINDTDHILPGGKGIGEKFKVDKIEVTRTFTNDENSFPIMTFKITNTDEYEANIGLSIMVNYLDANIGVQPLNQNRGFRVTGYHPHYYILRDDFMITDVDMVYNVQDDSICDNSSNYPFFKNGTDPGKSSRYTCTSFSWINRSVPKHSYKEISFGIVEGVKAPAFIVSKQFNIVHYTNGHIPNLSLAIDTSDENTMSCLYQGQMFELYSFKNIINLPIKNPDPPGNYSFDLIFVSKSGFNYTRTFYIKTVKPLELNITGIPQMIYAGEPLVLNGSFYSQFASELSYIVGKYAAFQTNLSNNNNILHFSHEIKFEKLNLNYSSTKFELEAYALNIYRNETSLQTFQIKVQQRPTASPPPSHTYTNSKTFIETNVETLSYNGYTFVLTFVMSTTEKIIITLTDVIPVESKLPRYLADTFIILISIGLALLFINVPLSLLIYRLVQAYTASCDRTDEPFPGPSFTIEHSYDENSYDDPNIEIVYDSTKLKNPYEAANFENSNDDTNFENPNADTNFENPNADTKFVNPYDDVTG